MPLIFFHLRHPIYAARDLELFGSRYTEEWSASQVIYQVLFQKCALCVEGPDVPDSAGQVHLLRCICRFLCFGHEQSTLRKTNYQSSHHAQGCESPHCVTAATFSGTHAAGNVGLLLVRRHNRFSMGATVIPRTEVFGCVRNWSAVLYHLACLSFVLACLRVRCAGFLSNPIRLPPHYHRDTRHALRLMLLPLPCPPVEHRILAYVAILQVERRI